MAETSSSSRTTAGADDKQRRSNDATILDNRRYLTERLEQLLVSSGSDKNALLAGLQELDMADAEGRTGLEEEEAPAIVAKIQSAIEEFKGSDPAVRSLRNDTKKQATATVSANTEQLDGRLRALVVEAIDALPEGKRRVRGKDRVVKARTGEEIARAIPDQAAFLAEIDQMKEGTFFELNERGQLVMKDGVKEAHGLGENELQARIRQTRIVYRDADGQTKVMIGGQYFKVTKRDGKSNPIEMELSDEAKKIDRQSIIMARGLPTLQWNESYNKHIGEYARMNDNGQVEREKLTWVEDETITDASLARLACWRASHGFVDSDVYDSNIQFVSLGSRGVLRVELNLES